MLLHNSGSQSDISYREVLEKKMHLRNIMIAMGFSIVMLMSASAGDIEDITKKANDMVQMMRTIQTTLDELTEEMRGVKKEMQELKKENHIKLSKIDKKVS